VEHQEQRGSATGTMPEPGVPSRGGWPSPAGRGPTQDPAVAAGDGSAGAARSRGPRSVQQPWLGTSTPARQPSASPRGAAGSSPDDHSVRRWGGLRITPNRDRGVQPAF